MREDKGRKGPLLLLYWVLNSLTLCPLLSKLSLVFKDSLLSISNPFSLVDFIIITILLVFFTIVLLKEFVLI